MIRRKAIGVALILLLFGGCQPIEADDEGIGELVSGLFYVAITGDDDNPGTQAEPWRTIQHAADRVGSGSTVYVRGGVYEEAVTINVSGSEAGGWVKFQSYEGETAVLDATNLTVPDADSALFLIEGQSYIVIEGFELRHYRTENADRVPMGIFVTGDAHHIQLINNNIHHIENDGGSDGNAHGIAVYGTEAPAAIHDVLIQGNDLHDLILGNSEALVLNGNVTDFTISQNWIHDSDNIGIDLIGFEGTAPDPAYDLTRDGVVSENVVYNIDTLANPAYFGEQSAAGIYVDGGTRILIERNQVYQSNFGVEIASEHNGRNVVDYNLYFAPAGEAASEWQWKNVNYQGFETYRAATGNDPHSLFADPLFVAETVLDLHLQTGSPAIDSGQNMVEVGALDFDGKARVQNGLVDLGALEGDHILDQFVYLALVQALIHAD